MSCALDPVASVWLSPSATACFDDGLFLARLELAVANCSIAGIHLVTFGLRWHGVWRSGNCGCRKVLGDLEE